MQTSDLREKKAKYPRHHKAKETEITPNCVLWQNWQSYYCVKLCHHNTMNFLKLTIAKWNYKDLLVHLKSIIMFFRNKIKLVGLRYKVFNLLCIMFLVCGNCALTSFFPFHLLMQVQPIIWRVTCLRASLRALA